MELHERQLLEGLEAFLWRREARCLLTQPEEWQMLWQLAAEQHVLPMAADALLPLYRRSGGADALEAQVRRSVFAGAAEQARRSRAFLQVYRRLMGQGTRPLVVKGILCRRLYPKPDLRSSADEDLLVREEEFADIQKVLMAEGFRRLDEESGDMQQVLSWYSGETGLCLELHRSLFAGDSAAYGGLNRFFGGAFSHAVLEPLEDLEVWTLAPEEHLLYLILHSLKHFLHSGFGIRQVCDICLFALSHGAQIEWNSVFSRLEQAYADVFAANLLEIGRKYLGFAEYPPELESRLACCEGLLDCDDLLEDLLSGGVFGGNTEERKHSSRITLNAAAAGAQSNSVQRLLRTAFPRRKELTRSYPYLQDCPWMLPAAWVQRLMRYRAENRGCRAAARESISIGERRVALMRKYRVIR